MAMRSDFKGPWSEDPGLRVSRRQFLTTLALPLVAAGCERHPYDARRFTRPARTAVGLYPAKDYSADFSDLISRGLRDLNIDLRGKKVLLKPNMVEYESGTAINTHPLVVAGAAVACRRAGAAEVVVGEAPGHRRDIEYLVSATGLVDQLKDHKLRFVDLNEDDVRMVQMASGFSPLTQMAFPVEVLRSDFVISMPKLKTHHWAGMTCSMKNLFGVVPGAVYGWPKNVLHVNGITESILDLTATVRPQLAIVDAVVAMEGDGPIMGRPRPMGFVAMGADPVAVDATCARIIGLDPVKIGYLKTAGQFLGYIDDAHIEQRGEAPARYATRFDVIHDLEYLRR